MASSVRVSSVRVRRAAARGRRLWAGLDDGRSLALAAVALAVAAWLGLVLPRDWTTEAWPSVQALLAGHVGGFLAQAPVYGGSLILRAPFMLAAALGSGGQFAVYWSSAVPCLLAVTGLGLWLSAHARRRGGSRTACALVLVLCIANPLVISALRFGHPEEVLGAALSVGAVLCALDDRPAWTAVLLGLAMANKEWAIVVIGPVLLALPRARWRVLGASCTLAGVAVAPLLLGGGLAAQTASVGRTTGQIFLPDQIWWFVGGGSAGWFTAHAHALIVALMPPLTGLCFLVRRGRRGVPDPLLLLALLLAARCILDPWDNVYYPVPFMLALLTWETLRGPRLPLMTLTASLLAWFTLRDTGYLGLALPRNTQAILFCAFSVPGVIVLAVRLYLPRGLQRVGGAPRAVVPAPTSG